MQHKIFFSYQLLIPLLFISITIGMILFPSATLIGASTGLEIFFFSILPALLPFLIISEILMGLGVVHFIGTLLEPLMRPLFRIPGVGAFTLAMSLASGYLTGAIITARLRKYQMCTRVEAERIIAVTNVSNPIFILASVAVGMFHKPEIGLTLALAHYLACILVGLVFRFHGYKEESSEPKPKLNNILIRSWQEMQQARYSDGRPLGQLMGESVQQGINSVLVIGGFLVLFSVISNMLNVTGCINLLSHALAKLLPLFDEHLFPGFLNGIVEVTLGCSLISNSLAPLEQKILLVSTIIAWSGLSVHAQVLSIIGRTDIRLLPYFSARILHAFFATALSLIMLTPDNLFQRTIPTLAQQPSLTQAWNISLQLFLGALGILLLLSLIIFWQKKIKLIICKTK